jgi:glyoxylase-like metal-dependent hydrolase (beta-lactamase superfamily II)/rhodanese-related sulfurtransferase
MEVIPVDASDLGNQAYVVTDGARAVAIDPPRPVAEVVELVRSRGLRLELVVDTHLHNDHVSGGPELAQETGAVYAVCADEHVRGARGIVDGDRFTIGALTLTVKDTPGHTQLHQSFIVSEGDACAVFTGGSLLIGTVGRTDLLGAGLAASLASAQWSSVRWMLDNLPHDAGVHPTHGFGSFCSSNPCSGTETTIGAERVANPAAHLDCETFVKTLLAGFGEYPSYFAHMATRNRLGLQPASYRDPVPTLADGDIGELATRMWVIDVRPRATFADGHVPGTVNAGLDGPFATYVGWTMPWEAPFALVASDDAELSRARDLLAHIGLDLPVGTAVPTPGARSDRLRLASFGELATEWTDDVTVIDVRRTEEWDAGHLEGALHVPVHRLDETCLPEGTLWLHCAAGYRAVLGASLLRRAGREVVAIDDMWSSAADVGLRTCRADAP